MPHLADLPESAAGSGGLAPYRRPVKPRIAIVLDVGVEAVESLTARGKRALPRR